MIRADKLKAEVVRANREAAIPPLFIVQIALAASEGADLDPFDIEYRGSQDGESSNENEVIKFRVERI